MDRRYASAFLEPAVAASYRYRPAYPDALFARLTELAGEAGEATALDVGCGTGDIARPLAQLVSHVDAIDVSQAMIDEARTLPGGDSPAITWTCSTVEDAALRAPYSIITAGESVHWLDWPVAFARFQQVLAPEGSLALIKRTWGTGTSDELEIIKHHSTNQEFQPTAILDELRSRNLFEPLGDEEFEIPWKPTLDEYIEARHSQASFSRDQMGPDATAAFDRDVETLLAELFPSGVYEMTTRFSLIWGRPLAPTN